MSTKMCMKTNAWTTLSKTTCKFALWLRIAPWPRKTESLLKRSKRVGRKLKQSDKRRRISLETSPEKIQVQKKTTRRGYPILSIENSLNRPFSTQRWRKMLSKLTSHKGSRRSLCYKIWGSKNKWEIKWIGRRPMYLSICGLSLPQGRMTKIWSTTPPTKVSTQTTSKLLRERKHWKECLIGSSNQNRRNRSKNSTHR